jgi:hypothetical protein
MFGVHKEKHSEAARDLVQFLNSSRNEHGFERVEKIVEQITEADEKARTVRAMYEEKNREKNSDWADVERLEREVQQSVSEIRRFYRQMKVSVSPLMPEEGGWHPHLSLPRNSELATSVGALLVLQATLGGYIHLIRRCTVCKTWFISTRSWNVYCPGGCRERNANEKRKTPQGRAERREYRRKYRAIQKRRDAENLRASAKKRGE